MGKRKHKESQERIRKKIRKLEKRLRRHEDSDSSNESHVRGDRHSAYSYYEDSIMEVTDSDASNSHTDIRSAVHVVEINNEPLTGGSPKPTTAQIVLEPSTSKSANQQNLNTTSVNSGDCQTTNIPTDILDILGNSKKKEEVFGPQIQEEISKRWGRILCEGLNKEQKKELIENILVPENFQLVKAPNLNPEIAAVLTESTKNRDKRLEKTQNYLGLGISALTSLISSLVERDNNVDKMQIIKRLSETNQILLDLHFESTLNRRKLITYTLDKKFVDLVQDVQRDSLLFGENLTEKIKASKAAEKSVLQFKRVNTSEVSAPKKFTSQQENWRGPPRQTQRGNRRGGAKTRPTYRSTRRPAPTTDHYQDSLKSHPRTKSHPRNR